MSADMHIHIFDEIEEEDLSIFFSNSLGSKWFRYGYVNRGNTYKKISMTPNIWVGEVSWLKAMLFEDDAKYIPDTIEKIQNIIGEELPIIDDKMIKDIISAFSLSNNTIMPNGVWKGRGYRLAEPDDIKKFLELYKGKQVFTVSW